MGDKEGASWRVSSKLMVLQEFRQTTAMLHSDTVLTRGLVLENVRCKRDEGSTGNSNGQYSFKAEELHEAAAIMGKVTKNPEVT
jgi:hypothetical protein